jgi:putative transposase
MARQPRIDLGGYVYHVINRASGRVPIFKTKDDFLLFEDTLAEAQQRDGMRILAYCVMPNHFHFALYPETDGEIQRFMGWLTKTHTQRWHAMHRTIGHGHLYQGRYKSFIVNTDSYFLTLMKYIEQNPLRAKLVRRAQDWQWGSLHRRIYGTPEQRKLLSKWPITTPQNYLKEVNQILQKETLSEIRTAVIKGSPLGVERWRNALIDQLGLAYTTKGVGRPKNGS